MNGLHHGTREGYVWFWSPHASLRMLLDAVPELVLGRVVAITAFESGPFRVTEHERAQGWTNVGDVAYSAPVSDPRALPLGEWDEWYVLNTRRELRDPHVFVNYFDFAPEAADLSEMDPTWDRAVAEEMLRYRRQRAERFWQQLVTIQPIAFLAEGHALTCVAADEMLFPRILAAISPPAR